jgi:hypothetical protein
VTQTSLARPHPDTIEKTSLRRILTYAGTIVAFLIGSGFATGQEVLQSFSSHGYWGIFGTGTLVLVLMTCVAVELLSVGQARRARAGVRCKGRATIRSTPITGEGVDAQFGSRSRARAGG